jgi:hypothetical protein
MTHKCSCLVEFDSIEALEKHREEMHKPDADEIIDINHTKCLHLTTLPAFEGLDHMNGDTAGGWFTDECVLCGHKTKAYLMRYVRTTIHGGDSN